MKRIGRAIMLPIGVAVSILMSFTRASAETDSPYCDDPEVTETIQDTFDTHQAYVSKTNLILESVTEVAEIGFAAHAGGDWRATRACSASGSLSNGETISIWYHVRMPVVEDNIGYRVKPCFSKYDGLNKTGCSAFATAPTP